MIQAVTLYHTYAVNYRKLSYAELQERQRLREARQRLVDVLKGSNRKKVEPEVNLFQNLNSDAVQNSDQPSTFLSTFSLPKKTKGKHQFSIESAKRLNKCVHNFMCSYLALHSFSPELLKVIDSNGKHHTRKPVFLTLTVPSQNTTDYDVKAKALNLLIQNLQRTYNVRSYIWKAEAQLRGDIHFHIIIDCFVYHKDVRRLWFRELQRLNCLPEGAKLSECSRLVWMKVCHNTYGMAKYLSSYLTTRKVQGDSLVHKHNDEEVVRQISGNSWGCSDNLRYQQMTLEDLTYEELTEIESWYSVVKPLIINEKIVAYLYLNLKDNDIKDEILRYHQKKFTEKITCST